MAILSLFAITLLSAQAFELPSTSETMRDFQRRFAPLKAEVSTSLKELVAPISHGVQKLAVSESSLHASPMAMQSSPHVMQDMDACYEAMMSPCFAGIDVIDNVMTAENATEAVTLFEDYCMNCTDPVADFANVTTTCNITDEATVATFTNMADLLDNACDDTTCAGNVVWAFADIEDRRASLCPNVECGLSIVYPLVSEMLVNATGDNCLSNLFELYCLVDDDAEDTMYCVDFLDQLDDDGPADLCNASTCAAELTVVYDALLEEECGIVEPFNECDDEDTEAFTLIHFCTMNENDEHCYDLIMDDESNVTACGDVFDMVPAPGADIEAPTECPAGCAAQLQTFVDTAGCCAGFALDLSCADPALRTFIGETCEVAYDTCERPTVATTLTPTETSGVVSVVVAFASIFFPAALSMLM